MRTPNLNRGLKGLAVTMLAACSFTAFGQNTTFQILHASDFEAGLKAVNDAPRFAAIVDALDDTYSNTLILSSGDNYIPSPFLASGEDPSLVTPLKNAYISYYGSNFANNDLRAGIGRPDISIMNFIGIEAAALGNHEFDLGTSEVRNIIGGVNSGTSIRWFGAQFPYLSSNLDFSGDANLSPIFEAGIVENTNFRSNPTQTAAQIAAVRKLATSTFIIKNGEKIGIVGVTTPILAAISSPGATTVKNPGAGTNDMALLATIVQPVIDALIAQEGVNKVILLAHLQQLSLEKQLAPLLRNVDIIIGGGSNTLMADAQDRLRDGDVAAETYPFLTNDADGNPLVIVNTDGEYKYVGRLVVDFTPEGLIVPASINENISGVFAADDAGVEEFYPSVNDAFTMSIKASRVKSLTDAIGAAIQAKDSRTFGKTDVYLQGLRNFVRTEETNLGNITADANLWQAKQVDNSVVISLKNGGGIRSSMGVVNAVGDQVEFLPPAANAAAGKEEGEISQLDIENSLRFNNRLSLLTLTATNMKAILEHSVGASGPGQTQGRFPQVSGLKISYDLTQPAGSRIRNAAVVNENNETIDSLIVNGAVYGNPSRTFRIVTLNFLAGGGDSYPFNTLATNRLDIETVLTNPGVATFTVPGSEQDAFAEYMALFYGTTPYNIAETPASQDTRLQDISLRSDCVFLPVISNIEGNTILCSPRQSGSATFSIDAVEGASNYAWSVPTGAVITSGQGTPSITVSWSQQAITVGVNGNICVEVTTPCGIISKCEAMSINYQTPIRPGTILGLNRVCPGELVTLMAQSSARAASYAWTAPIGMQLVSMNGREATFLVTPAFVSGNVSVVASNSCGSSSARTRFFTRNNPLRPSIISGSVSVAAGQTEVAYSVNNGFGVEYNWTVPSSLGTIVSGQRSNQIEINASSTLSSGNTISVVAQNGCGVSTARTLTNISVVAPAVGEARSIIAPFENELTNVVVFPNPFENQIIIEIDATEEETSTLMIHDMSGRILVNTLMEGNQFVIDTPQITAGVYFLTVQNAKGSYTARVVKN
jgi:2',3'-cyclic-nucleotide 2'-phosphodiesterase (5'-nucleotidase family)